MYDRVEPTLLENERKHNGSEYAEIINGRKDSRTTAKKTANLNKPIP